MFGGTIESTMKTPALSPNELERLADLYDYGILDTAAEQVFDEIAELAASICGTRFAAVTLIDRDRQWFKSEFGYVFGRVSRDESVCGHAILETEFFEVPDTQLDERFTGNPVLEGSPHIRFYGGSRLNSSHGNAIGMLCVLDSEPRELTALQRQSLRQLADVAMAVIEAGRQSRHLSWLGALVDRVSDEVFVADPDSLRYLYANGSALQRLGYTLDQICTIKPMDVMKDLDHARLESYVAQLRTGVPHVTIEGTGVRGNGKEYPVEIRWQLLTTRGRPVVLSVLQDITQRREVERAKSEFISVVNHELRTPLTSIHGALKLLVQGAAGELPPKAARLVELAGQNTERLRTLVDDILDLEKIASGRMEVKLETIDVAAVLAHAVHACEPAARAANLALTVRATESLWLCADSHRLQQVVGNFVSNALKFAPAGSVVALAADPVPAGVRVSVTDTGPGVAEHFRSRIFQRFAQADMNNNRRNGGSGLGLSIAKQMTELMGGRIGYESEPGRTVFHVTFPRASE